MKQLIDKLHSGKITQLNERYRVLDAHGHWQWTLTRAEPSHWSAQSKPTHISGVDIRLPNVSEDHQTDTATFYQNDSPKPAGTQVLHEVIKTLSVALESAGQGVWHIDERAGGSTSNNSVWRTMRGHPANGEYSLGSQRWYDDVHPDDLDIVKNRNDIRDEMNTNITDYTYRHRHTDGSWRWIWVRGKIIERDTAGKPLRRVGSDTDITSIKEVEQRYERLSSTLNLAMQAAGMGVWEWRVNAEGSYWDTRACNVFGLGGEGRFVPSTEFLNSIHPDDLDELELQLESAKRECLPISVEYRIMHPTLGVRHIKTHADYHGFVNEPSRYVGLVWDVTDAYRRESELANANHLLDGVIEHMDQGLVLFSGEDRATSQVALANNRFFSILELPEKFRSKDTTLHSYISYMKTNGYFSLEATILIDLFMQRMEEQDITAMLLNTPSGSTVRATARRMEFDSFIVTFSDITDLIRAEDEQKELSRRLNHNHRMQSIGELTGGIAHDFNNLLAIISGNAELLGMSMDGNNNRHVQAVIDAAHRGAELTQSLLAFSSKQTLKPAVINMSTLVEDVCRMLDRTLGDTIAVLTSMPDVPWTCMADPRQLENALINLAVNARDAMPQGGTLTIEVINRTFQQNVATANTEISAGDYIQVTVSDSGSGMSQSTLKKAIDPFFTTKRVGEGSGLGLSMVFGFVNQSSGHLDISSSLGNGTAVSIYLPRSFKKSDNVPAAKPVKHSWQKGEGQCILLVEDDEDVKQVLTSGLTRLGYEIVSVGTASQALRAIDSLEKNIDLVISDVMLPDGVNGFELGKAIQEKYQYLPVIYMSGYAQSALTEAYDDYNEFDLLQKPFSIDKLAGRIANRLEPAVSS